MSLVNYISMVQAHGKKLDRSVVLIDAVQKSNKKKKRKAVVLEEDDYVETLDSIIKRDYFPALNPLERMLTGGSRRQSSVIQSSRRQTDQSVRSSFDEDTPDLRTHSPARFVRGSRRDRSGVEDDKQDNEQKQPKKPKDLRLDQFTRAFTSEDNESFSEIQEKEAKIKADKVFWLEENGIQADRVKLLTDSSNPNYDPKQTGLLESWGYEVKNGLMFHPQGDHHPSLEEKKATMVTSAPKKEIVKENTRFPGGFFDKPTREQEEILDASTTPMVGGYKLMRTPSPAPGRNGDGPSQTPFMTWGDIAGTPLHLRNEDDDDDPEDLDIDLDNVATKKKKKKSKGASGGFRVPNTPSRDEIAWRLDARAKKKKNSSSKKGKTPFSKSPGTPRTPRTPTLSPAAQKLLSSGAFGSKSRGDSQLRASYASPSPSPARRPPSHRSKTTPSPLPFSSPLVS